MRMRSGLRAVAVGGRDLPPRTSGDGGMVIAEAALAVPALVGITAALAWALLVGTANLAVGDAARLAARDLARGVSMGEALARAEASVAGSHASSRDEGDSVVVVVTKDVSAPVPILSGIDVTVSQQVAVPKEWQ